MALFGCKTETWCNSTPNAHENVEQHSFTHYKKCNIFGIKWSKTWETGPFDGPCPEKLLLDNDETDNSDPILQNLHLSAQQKYYFTGIVSEARLNALTK